MSTNRNSRNSSPSRPPAPPSAQFPPPPNSPPGIMPPAVSGKGEGSTSSSPGSPPGSTYVMPRIRATGILPSCSIRTRRLQVVSVFGPLSSSSDRAQAADITNTGCLPAPAASTGNETAPSADFTANATTSPPRCGSPTSCMFEISPICPANSSASSLSRSGAIATAGPSPMSPGAASARIRLNCVRNQGWIVSRPQASSIRCGSWAT